MVLLRKVPGVMFPGHVKASESNRSVLTLYFLRVQVHTVQGRYLDVRIRKVAKVYTVYSTYTGVLMRGIPSARSAWRHKVNSNKPEPPG